MSIETLERTVLSTDGIHTLRGILIKPEGEIRGVLQISHGMTEHIGRYIPFMEYLAEKGFAVFGHDHIGHGKTAENESELGYFAKKDGYKTVVRDIHAFGEAVSSEFPDKKHFLLGHSMGSFIARLAAEEFPSDFDGLIIMGTGGPNPISDLGLALTSVIRLFKGEKHISKLANAAAFSTYNKKTDSDNPFAWLTHDEELLAIHDADAFCMFSFTVSAMHDLIHLQKAANRKAWYQNLPLALPVFLVSGDMDPVGDYGKGVTIVHSRLAKRGLQDLTIKLYPDMRHEILNEIGRSAVMEDLHAWLQARV